MTALEPPARCSSCRSRVAGGGRRREAAQLHAQLQQAALAVAAGPATVRSTANDLAGASQPWHVFAPMHHHHHPLFVVLSLVVAVLGSWTALDLFRRVRSHIGRTQRVWLE